MSSSNSTNGAHERAAAYARSSDDKQEASCPQQLAWARQKAEVCNLELAVIRFDDGVPGDVIDRPGLEALFADLARFQKARRPVTTLLLFDQDRLSRGTSWAAGALMERLSRLGVERVVTASRALDLWDDADRAIFGIEQDLAKRGYVKALSRTVSRAMASLALAGYWCGGQAPYGYRIAGGKNQRHLVPGPAEEVEAVRELFRLAALGALSTSALARLANERGWPVPTASAFKQRGRLPRWTRPCVGRLLRQVVYLGTIRYGKRRQGKYHQAGADGPVEMRGPSREPVAPLEREKCHEPLIDAQTWQRAQAALSSRRLEQRKGRRRPEDFAFSGRLECGCCGGTMYGMKAAHGYVCGTWHDGEGCSRNGISEAMLMDAVASLLARELDRPATLARLRKRLEAGRTACGEVQRAALEKGRKRVADLEGQVDAGERRLLSVAADLLPSAEKQLRRLLAELGTARADLAELEKQSAAQVAEEQDTEELLARLSQLPALLRGADGGQRVRVVQAAVEKIVLRFTTKTGPKGLHVMSRWTGGTLTLRGGGPTHQISVPGGEATPATW
jgi:site-specific DNA recombinase